MANPEQSAINRRFRGWIRIPEQWFRHHRTRALTGWLHGPWPWALLVATRNPYFFPLANLVTRRLFLRSNATPFGACSIFECFTQRNTV